MEYSSCITITEDSVNKMLLVKLISGYRDSNNKLKFMANLEKIVPSNVYYNSLDSLHRKIEKLAQIDWPSSIMTIDSPPLITDGYYIYLEFFEDGKYRMLQRGSADEAVEGGIEKEFKIVCDYFWDLVNINNFNFGWR